MSHARSKVKEEIARLVPSTIFFLTLHRVALMRSPMLERQKVLEMFFDPP